MAVYYVGDNNPDGSTFGSSSSEKISFYNATPVTQPATIGTAVTAAITTPASTTTTTWQGLANTRIRNLAIKINALINRAETLGLIASS